MKKDALCVAKELVEILEELHKENMVMLSELKPGEKFTTGIGNFIVLDQENGRTKVVTEELYRQDVEFDDNFTDYNCSEIKKIFDGEITKDFSEEFGEDNIISEKADLVTVDGQSDYGYVEAGVRPLTFDEVRKYNDFLVDENLPDWYWSCTSWSTKDRGYSSILVVSPRGDIFVINCNCDFGVRPVCILKSNLFVSRVKED